MKTIKNITILVATLLISASSYCQVQLNSSLEVGYEDRYLSIYQLNAPTAVAYLKNTMFSTVDVSASFRRFSLYSDIKTYMKPISPVEYQPIQSQYRIGARYGISRFEFRYEHLCSHSLDQPFFHEGYDRVSVKVYLINR